MIHFSLFSGIGGFDLASEWMGWKNYLSCEINEFGNKILEYYWADAYHHRDIHTLTYETIDIELSRRFGSDWRNDDIILTGGFPCQPYSSAGKQLGKEDERHLWPEMLRCIREVQPKWIVGENVLGIVNWSGGLVFEEVQADLEAEGYEVQSYVLPACAVNGGAPHRRDRVWFVAYCDSNGSGSQYEFRTRGNLSKEWIDKCGIAPDTNCGRLEGATEIGRDCEYVIGQGILGNAPDTDNEGLQEWNITEWDDSQRRKKSSGSTEQHTSDDWKTQIPNWNNFPSTQPTIRSGDDGLSNGLDGITFPKWRQQSIMAYGNAVVPQVVYQIFKSIEQYELSQQPPDPMG